MDQSGNPETDGLNQCRTTRQSPLNPKLVGSKLLSTMPSPWNSPERWRSEMEGLLYPIGTSSQPPTIDLLALIKIELTRLYKSGLFASISSRILSIAGSVTLLL